MTRFNDIVYAIHSIQFWGFNPGGYFKATLALLTTISQVFYPEIVYDVPSKSVFWNHIMIISLSSPGMI